MLSFFLIEMIGADHGDFEMRIKPESSISLIITINECRSENDMRYGVK